MKHKKFQRWKKSHIAAMVRMRKHGINNIEIAKHFDTSPESVALQFHKIKVETGVPIKRGKKVKLSNAELKQMELTPFRTQSELAFEEMKKNAPTLSPQEVEKARKSAELFTKWKPIDSFDPLETTPTGDRIELGNLVRELSVIVDKLLQYSKPVSAPSMEARLKNLSDGFLDLLDELIYVKREIAALKKKHVSKKNNAHTQNDGHQ